jgi:hypothetical protein
MKPRVKPDDGSLKASSPLSGAGLSDDTDTQKLETPASSLRASVLPLSTLQPDAARAARTRQRCRSVLQRRVRVADAVAPDPCAGRVRQPTPAELAFRHALAGAVGILCLVYLVALITITASLR